MSDAPVPGEDRFHCELGSRGGVRVVAEERTDRPGVVVGRIWNGQQKKYEKFTVPRRIRSATGKRIKEAEAAARRYVKDRFDEAVRAAAKLPPATPQSTPPAVPAVAPVVAPAVAPAAAPTQDLRATLTVHAGCTAAMVIGSSGMFAVRSDHTRDLETALARARLVIGPERTWSSWQPLDYQVLWRALIVRHVESVQEMRDAESGGATRRPSGGKRAIELVVIALVRVARWLVLKNMLLPGVGIPPGGWGQMYADDWDELTAVIGTVPHDDDLDEDVGPRYSEEEFGRFLLSLNLADPRLALLIELAAEARLGQVRRTMRSDLHLDGGVRGLGYMIVRGRKKKGGVRIDFDQQQRDAFDHARTNGYLSALEAAYREQVITDYPVFAAGHLYRGDGVAAADTTVYSNKRTLNDWMTAFEIAVEIEHVDGRSHYGLRRIASDLAQDVETDTRVLDLLMGHVPFGTRSRRYQSRHRDALRERVVVTRRALRDRAIAAELARRARDAEDA